MSHRALRRRVLHIVATLSVTSLIAACGYKGPLYMPSNPPQHGIHDNRGTTAVGQPQNAKPNADITSTPNPNLP